MAKAPPPGKCVHCLKDPVELTWDHVFPKSWYPNTTPLNNPKWKIPTCLVCNNKFGKIEEDMLLRLGLCVDPTKIAASGIADTVLRALNPDYGKGERDKRIRERKKETVLNEIEENNQLKKIVALPGFEERWGQSLEQTAKLSISIDSIKLLTQKIVRGAFYIRYGKFIELPYAIESVVVDQDCWEQLTQFYKQHGFAYENGPGISIYGAVAQDDPATGGFSISIWAQFKMLAFVKNPNYPDSRGT